MTPLQGAKPKGGQTSLIIFGQDWMDVFGNKFPFENFQPENKTI